MREKRAVMGVERRTRTLMERRGVPHLIALSASHCSNSALSLSASHSETSSAAGSGDESDSSARASIDIDRKDAGAPRRLSDPNVQPPPPSPGVTTVAPTSAKKEAKRGSSMFGNFFDKKEKEKEKEKEKDSQGAAAVAGTAEKETAAAPAASGSGAAVANASSASSSRFKLNLNLGFGSKEATKHAAAPAPDAGDSGSAGSK